jgi:hypothetical protein
MKNENTLVKFPASLWRRGSFPEEYREDLGLFFGVDVPESKEFANDYTFMVDNIYWGFGFRGQLTFVVNPSNLSGHRHKEKITITDMQKRLSAEKREIVIGNQEYCFDEGLL